jgi:uncharacterized metal-binding protein
MPSGKIHTRITIATAVLSTPIIIIAWLRLLWVPWEIFWVIPGILLGIFITPDLDHDATIVSHRYVNGLFGGVAFYWWYYLWHSYSISFKHRSTLSHAPIIGTVIRLTFLLFPPIIVLFRNQQTRFAQSLKYLVISTVMIIPILGVIFVLAGQTGDFYIVLFVVMGLMLADFLHFIADSFS